MSRRLLAVLLAALAVAPSFGAPLEAARVDAAPAIAVPAIAVPATPALAAAAIADVPPSAPFAAAAMIAPARPAAPAALPSARTSEGVAARVAGAARAWGAPVESILGGHDVLLFGENHGSLESVETLTRELPRLAAAGVTAIGIEGLKRPHQAAVDAYVSGRSARVPNEALAFSPRRVAALSDLLAAARAQGVRVVALGLPLEYWAEEAARAAATNTGQPAREFSGSAAVQFRRAQSGYEAGFNEAVAEVYLTRRNQAMADFVSDALKNGGKAVVLVGQAHVDGLDMIPGRLLNAPGQWGTLAGELTKRALRAFSLTQTGGLFVDEEDARDDRLARPLSYRVGGSADGGAPTFVSLGPDRGLWHAGPARGEP